MRKSQLGFTMVELMVAITLAMLILAGTVIILRYTVVTTAANADRTMAQLQTHYVGFWLGQDVVQAQTVSIGNSSWEWAGEGSPIDIIGFPLEIDDTIKYDLVRMEGEFDSEGHSLGRLERTEYTEDGNITSVVGEYILPWLEVDQKGTRCYKKSIESSEVLVLELTAMVDRAEANSRYEIAPRLSNVVWE
jgi:hypothetical protein